MGKIQKMNLFKRRLRASPLSSNELVIRTLIVALPVVVFAWLFNQRYIVTPSVTLHFVPGSASGPIRPQNPLQLVSALGQDDRRHWLINTDVFPFTVRIPRLIEKITVQVRLISKNQPSVRLVARGPAELGDIWFPLRERALDQLTWPAVQTSDLHLWQRPSPKTLPGQKANNPITHFSSVEDFFKAQATLERVGVMGLHPMSFARVRGDQSTESKIDLAIRGKHTLLGYAPKPGPMQLSFVHQDLNWAAGADTITVVVRRAWSTTDPRQQLVTRRLIRDDGNITKNKKLGPSQIESFSVSIPEEGMYEIILSTSTDVRIKSIHTNLPSLSFWQYLWLAEGPAYHRDEPFTPRTVTVVGDNLSAEISHSQALQTIKVGEEELRFDKVRIPKTVAVTPDTEFRIAKADVVIRSKGVLVVGETELPDRPVKVFSFGEQTKFDTVDYLISNYHPRPDSPELNIQVTLPADDLGLVGKHYQFRIEAPGLRLNQTELELRLIQARLTPGPFPWYKIFDKARSLNP